MESNVKNISFRLLMLIATKKIVKVAEEVLNREGLAFQYRFHAEGTASSEIIDMLGLGNVDKYVLISVMPRQSANKMLKKLHKECSLNTAGSGIAFTVPFSSSIISTTVSISPPILASRARSAGPLKNAT